MSYEHAGGKTKCASSDCCERAAKTRLHRALLACVPNGCCWYPALATAEITDKASRFVSATSETWQLCVLTWIAFKFSICQLPAGELHGMQMLQLKHAPQSGSS